MDFPQIISLLLIFVHIAAFIAGGANSVLMPIIGPRLVSATPEVRSQLVGIAEVLSKVSRVAMGTLLVTGILVLWLKWNWAAPNPFWFWLKMAGIVAMLVFIVLGARAARMAQQGDKEAARRTKSFGQLTGLGFVLVVLSAVFAFG